MKTNPEYVIKMSDYVTLMSVDIEDKHFEFLSKKYVKMSMGRQKRVEEFAFKWGIGNRLSTVHLIDKHNEPLVYKRAIKKFFNAIKFSEKLKFVKT